MARASCFPPPTSHAPARLCQTLWGPASGSTCSPCRLYMWVLEPPKSPLPVDAWIRACSGPCPKYRQVHAAVVWTWAACTTRRPPWKKPPPAACGQATSPETRSLLASSAPPSYLIPPAATLYLQSSSSHLFLFLLLGQTSHAFESRPVAPWTRDPRPWPRAFPSHRPPVSSSPLPFSLGRSKLEFFKTSSFFLEGVSIRGLR